jgi:hypothetical protein
MMGLSQLTVTRSSPDTFHVETPAGTRHEVSVPAGFPARLSCAHVASEDLVSASFEFLLEREPATSILREFSLDVIARYFPDYPGEISARFAPSG